MPEERARPSLIEPASGPFLSLLVQALEIVGRPGDRDVLIRAVEKGIQDEMDEQLRILNDKGIKDRVLRDMII